MDRRACTSCPSPSRGPRRDGEREVEVLLDQQHADARLRGSAPSTSPIWSTTAGASPSDGSSSNDEPGLVSSARAMASICCSPPDSCARRCCRRSARRGKQLEHARRGPRPVAPAARPSASVEVLAHRQRRQHPAALRHERDAGAGDRRRRAGRPARAVERTLPARGRTSPMSACMSVVLPTPLRPSSASAARRRRRDRRRAARCCAGSRRRGRRPRAAVIRRPRRRTGRRRRAAEVDLRDLARRAHLVRRAGQQHAPRCSTVTVARRRGRPGRGRARRSATASSGSSAVDASSTSRSRLGRATCRPRARRAAAAAARRPARAPPRAGALAVGQRGGAARAGALEPDARRAARRPRSRSPRDLRPETRCARRRCGAAARAARCRRSCSDANRLECWNVWPMPSRTRWCSEQPGDVRAVEARPARARPARRRRSA